MHDYRYNTSHANRFPNLSMEPPGREAILKALELNPGIITPLYYDAMSHHLSEEEIIKDMELIDRYLEQHLDILKKPAIEFMSDQEIKTVTLITKHFHAESHFIKGRLCPWPVSRHCH